MNHFVTAAIHQDIVIDAIRHQTFNANNLNFRSLRNFAGIDHQLHAALDRGRLTIHRQALLNQYLFSYGPMVERQWAYIFPKTLEMLNDHHDADVHLFDYGCGQGLASLLLLEKVIGMDQTINKVTLIEPSQIALQRAAQIMACKLPNATIIPIQKKLDDVSMQELHVDQDKMNVHLFSNVLDIESFDQFEVFRKLLKQGGTHYVMAVSNDRDCYGGAPRLEALYDALHRYAHMNSNLCTITHATLDRFTDQRGMNHLYFFLKLEINAHG